MVTLAVSAEGPEAWDNWRAAFARVAPELKVQSWFAPDFDPSQANYALVWEPAPGDMQHMTHMRAVLCSGAGVDHLVQRDDFPHGVPLVRMGGDQTVTLMADFVMWASIGLLRDARRWALQQQEQVWHRNLAFQNSDTARIGLLGFGNLGAGVARRLAKAGFNVSAWCRSVREDQEIELFCGHERLGDFLSQSDIVVNLLPSTPQTQNLIDEAFLKRMKPGAGLVNVGRGEHVVEADLLKMLDAGALSGAVLDVVRTEPLPQNSPLWAHPLITITPHMASEASPDAQALYVAQSIRDIEAGKAPALLYNAQLGY